MDYAFFKFRLRPDFMFLVAATSATPSATTTFAAAFTFITFFCH
jgi:hypothetical protein